MGISSSGRVGRVLITNDDGIDARGLAILEGIARDIADEVWVFAPDDNCSGYGRSLTLKRELKVSHHGDRRMTCDGTPTDCMILALNHFMNESRPDLVLSGINLGMNVADDITCSGTIGAAWEAVVHGVPAIALSQKYSMEIPRDNPDVFAAAEAHALNVIRMLIDEGWPDNVIMNVNFPSLPADEVKGVKPITVGRHKNSDDVLPGSGENTYRIGMARQRLKVEEGTDIGALLDGHIAVCPLSINMTDRDFLGTLTEKIA